MGKKGGYSSNRMRIASCINLPGAIIISCFFVRTRKNVRSFCSKRRAAVSRVTRNHIISACTQELTWSSSVDTVVLAWVTRAEISWPYCFVSSSFMVERMAWPSLLRMTTALTPLREDNRFKVSSISAVCWRREFSSGERGRVILIMFREPH